MSLGTVIGGVVNCQLNTFYYHLQNLDNVARKALVRLEIEKEPLTVLAGFPEREVGRGALTKLQNLAQRGHRAE